MFISVLVDRYCARVEPSKSVLVSFVCAFVSAHVCVFVCDYLFVHTSLCPRVCSSVMCFHVKLCGWLCVYNVC